MRRLLGSFAVLAILAAGCSSDEAARKPVHDADEPCAERSNDGFYAENATYVDTEPLELPRAKGGLDMELLEDATEEIARSRSTLSFLVLHNGELVWERYFNGSRSSHAENVHSLSKSILSLLVHRAIENGHLERDTRIADVLEVPQPARDLTVEHLLTMSAGLQWTENETEFEIEDEPSLVQAVLDRPRDTKPGKFHYSTGLSHVLSAVLAEATGMSTCEYAQKELFGPLGITPDHWPTDDDGYHTGGHSLFMTPREIARIGAHVLEENIAAESRWGDECGAPGERRGYGDLWWISGFGRMELQSASGFGGQALILSPSDELALVMTSDTFGNPADYDVVAPMEVMTNYVLPAAGVTVEPWESCETFDLYRTELGAKGARRLTDDLSLDIFGEPSPDGSDIAFHSRRDLNWEIYVMDADGSSERRLTHDRANDAFPRWSPDGQRIVFSREAGSRSGIYTMRPDGTDIERLTNGKDITPAWSPDGRRIAFSRTTAQPDEHTLWVMDADGSDERRIEEGFLGVLPDWAPTSDEIVFTSRNGREHVYTIEVDGGERKRIAEGRDPRFMPDGSLVFAQKRDTYRIVHRTKDGIVALVDSPGDDVNPAPTADGETLVYASAAAGSVEP